MSRSYFPGWGLDEDTVERLGYEICGKHKGIVYPISLDIFSNRIVAYQEPGFCLDIPEEKRDRLTLTAFPISNETMDLKKRLATLQEENKYLSFYDKDGNRYINSIDDYTLSYDRFFRFYMSKVNQFYRINVKKLIGKLYNSKDFVLPITQYDFAIINNIFTSGVSRIVLKYNKYNFFKENSKYRNKDEEEYCKTVTEVLTEIMIKYYIYFKYDIDPCDKEKSKLLLREIANSYDRHVEEVNSKHRQKKKIGLC